jgi:osmotically-inducible protein OsmY
MKRFSYALFSLFLLTAPVACSNWSRQTPKSMDNSTMEAEIRKNLAGDKITGLTITVDNGTVTLGGHVKSAADREQAGHDAQKVEGVKSVTNNLDIE